MSKSKDKPGKIKAIPQPPREILSRPTMLVRGLRADTGLIVLLLVIMAVYVGNLNGELISDDIAFLKDNKHYQSLDYLPQYFVNPFWSMSSDVVHAKNVPMYRPLVHTINLFVYKIFGLNLPAFHLITLILHMANTALLYVFTRRLFGVSALPALLGVALFALGTARVESVAWISGVPDPLVLFFFLLALFSHHWATEKKQIWWFVSAMACFQLALLSKEVAIVFPVIVLAFDYFINRHINWKALLGYAGLALLYIAIRSAVLGKAGGFSPFVVPDPSKTADFLAGYAGLLVLPLDVPFYANTPIRAVATLGSFIGLAMLVAFWAFVWRRIEKESRRSAGFALTWILASAWPIAILTCYASGYFAARLLYVPAAGMAIAVAIFFRNLNPRTLLLLATGVVLTYGGLSWHEGRAWRSGEAFNKKLLRDEPEGITGYLNLGNIYLDQNKLELAEEMYKASLDKQGTDKDRSIALYNLGMLRGVSGKISEAKSYLEQSITLNPSGSETLTGLGNIAWMENRLTEAAIYYQKALKSNPSNQEAKANLESILRRKLPK